MLLGQKHLQLDQLIHLDKTLLPIPPCQQYTPLTGKLTLLIKLDYLNLPFQKKFQFRYSLWGMPNKLSFEQNKSQLKITASLQLLSKYFWDMNILCIQIVSLLDTKTNQLMDNTMRRNKMSGTQKLEMLQLEKRIVGYTYVPLRKYFINHLISSFNSQKFVVLDQNKKRIGQLGVQMRIQMVQQNGLKFVQYINGQNSNNHLFNTNSHYVNQPSNLQIQASHRNKTNKNIYSQQQSLQNLQQNHCNKNLNNHLQNNKNKQPITKEQYKQFQKKLVQNKYEKKNYFSHQDIYLAQNSKPQILNQINNQEEDIFNFQQEKRANNKHQRANLKDTNKLIQKPEHTDLSLIRMKWGSNHPSVQLMKLRLDQVKYLNKQSSSLNIQNITNLSNQQIRLFLKDFIFLVGKVNSVNDNFLSISYISSNDKTLSKTQINLQNFNKNIKQNLININQMIVLNNANLQDSLLFQTLECQCKVTIKNLIKLQSVDLKRKDNKKRLYQLKYKVLNQQLQRKEQKEIHKQLQSHNKEQHQNRFGSKGKQTGKRTKQIQRIINSQQVPKQPNKQTSKQKRNFKGKLINSMIPQKQNGQKAPNQIKSPINRIFQSSASSNRPQQLFQTSQNNKKSLQQYFAQLLKYFQSLYYSQNQFCFSTILKLLQLQKQGNQEESNSQKQKQRLLNKLQDILTSQPSSQIKDQRKPNKIFLRQTIDQLFNSKFTNFYSTYQSFKSINQRYEEVTMKVTKLLIRESDANKELAQQQFNDGNYYDIGLRLNGILNYVKKYRKELINFGLIKADDLYAIIKGKLQQNISKHQNNHSGINNQENIPNKIQMHSLQSKQQINLINALLIIFTRYQSQYIKISQFGNFLSNFTSFRSKHGKQQVNLCINTGILQNLYKESIAKQDQNKFKEQKIYSLLQKLYFKSKRNNQQSQNQNLLQGQSNIKTGDALTLYKLIYEDPLNLQDVKSSIHFSNYNQSNITEHMNGNMGRRQRFRSQQRKFYNKRELTERQKSVISSQRMNTDQQISNSRQRQTQKQKIRLDTEEEQLIELMNRKKSKFDNIKNHKIEEDQTIGIEITKRQQFKLNGLKIPQQQYKKQEQLISNNNHKNLQQNSFVLNNLFKQPLTQYISVKCSISNVSPKSQICPQFNLFYLYQKSQNHIQQLKIKRNADLDPCIRIDNRLTAVYQQMVVPNAFALNINQKNQSNNTKKQPEQYLTLKLLNQQTYANYNLSQNRAQLIVKIRNLVGQQQYPIQNLRTKSIDFLLNVQIQQLDEQQQLNFQAQQNNKDNALNKNNPKYSRILHLNINRLICLQSYQMKECSHLRLIYQNPEGEINIRDVELANMMRRKDSYLDKHQNDAKSKNNKTKTRVIQLNISDLNLDINKQSYGNKKHQFKLFEIKKYKESPQYNQNHQLNKKQDNQNHHNSNFNKPSFKSKTSLPISRRTIANKKNQQNSAQQSASNNILNDESSCDFICQFQFNINNKQHSYQDQRFGINRQLKWLTDQKYRLEIEIYDVIYEKLCYQQAQEYKNKQSQLINKQSGGSNCNGDKLKFYPNNARTNPLDHNKIYNQNKLDENQQIWNQKINKIISVFKISNMAQIRNQFQKFYSKINMKSNYNSNSNQQNQLNFNSLISLISKSMNYRLTQKEIFLTLCFPASRNSKQNDKPLSQDIKLLYLIELFNLGILIDRNNKFTQNSQLQANQIIHKSNISTLSKLYQQFQTFDLEGNGYLSAIKFQVVKKVIPELNYIMKQRDAKFYYSRLVHKQSIKQQAQQMNKGSAFQDSYKQLSQLKSYKLISDAKLDNKRAKSCIDYLHLLWNCRYIYQDDFFNNIFDQHDINRQVLAQKQPQKKYPSHPKNRVNQKQSSINDILPQFYSIKILSFNNLRLNSIPCTLQFRINDIKLFQPIYRCYSNQFKSPYPTKLFQCKKQNSQTFTLKIYNRIVSLQKKTSKQEIYEYKLIQQINLANELSNQYKDRKKYNIKKTDLECENLEGSITVEMQIFQNRKQFDKCRDILQSNQEPIDLTLQKQQSNSPYNRNNINNISENKKILQKQFYQHEYIQDQQVKFNGYKQNKNRPIGESFLEVFQDQKQVQGRKNRKQTNQKENINRQENLLEKTRKEWQNIKDKNSRVNYDNQEQQNKQATIYDILKKQINEQEIQKKFDIFNNMKDQSSDSDQY